jgi:hypothetical protein
MAPSDGWHPDPTGRYSHRWWDGEGWTSRVFASGAVVEDRTPVAIPAGHKLHCGICHAASRTSDWKGRCRRCTLPLTSAYIAPKPQQEFKPGALIQAAQVSFEDVLADVDRALASGDEGTALRRLDTAIAYGTVLRAIASSSKARAVEPLTLAALIQLHLQALRLHARFAGHFGPEAFELTLLRRLAAMYSPERRDEIPETAQELVAFCASRAEWVAAECPEVNDAAAHYSSAFEWMSLRVALARLGYEFEDRRRTGLGPFPPGERGRLEAAAVLGVEPDGRPAAIKKAYYREAAKHHPDRLGEAPAHLRLAAEERMKEINAAYELLTA